MDHDVIRDQVRTSGGATIAPGCCTEDGRLSWPMMQARMGGGRVGITINRRALPLGRSGRPQPRDYAVPASVKGTLAGDVYACLLALADDEGVFPRVDAVADMCGQSCDKFKVVRALIYLVSIGLIAQRVMGMHRVLRIVPTGQILRTRGLPESEII